ncbi:hypothetical protein LUZ60_012758 [Juncus effusus]|nr:hypothetical protein LUZ60_012758 [Juncus effusus]
MKRHDGSSKMKQKGIGIATIFGCLIVFLIILTLLESNSRASAILNVQLSVNTYETLSTIEGANSDHHIQKDNESSVMTVSPKENQYSENSGSENEEIVKEPIRFIEDVNSNDETKAGKTNKLSIPAEENKDPNESNTGTEEQKPPLHLTLREETQENEEIVGKETNELTVEENPDSNNQNKADEGGEMMLPIKLTEESTQNEATEGFEDSKEEKSDEFEEQEEQNKQNTDSGSTQVLPTLIETTEQDNSIQNQKINKLVCDFTHPRADTCQMEGDVRILGTHSTVFLVSNSIAQNENTEAKVRPYARKWEKPTMQMITEVNIKRALNNQAPPCTVRHDVPVVVFSTGGFVGNVFHDYTDILIPLFLAANQYNGNVQFAVTDMSWWWIFKYLPIIRTLTPHPILNLDQDQNVHCFPSAQIGLKSHKPLGVDPTQSPNGYTMQDFRAFLRKSFPLKRSNVKKIDLKSGRKPRLLILLRRGTRAIMNEKQLVSMAKKVGFKVVTADPDKTREFPKFAHVVNSCDVMLGVHGAGLANMLYLPTNATVIQILPWGDLGFVGRHDYGLPLPDMGLKYVEYEIEKDESTLIHRYPKDHAVFTNPQEIHNQGWDTMYRIFLTEQNVVINVNRFKKVLIDVFKGYVQ